MNREDISVKSKAVVLSPELKFSAVSFLKNSTFQEGLADTLWFLFLVV